MQALVTLNDGRIYEDTRCNILPFARFGHSGTLWQSPAQAADQVTACAIRWDAWYTNGPTDPAHYTSDTLSRSTGIILPRSTLVSIGRQITWAASQESFDAEIRAASLANLCWAYVMYGKNNIINLSNPLMQGLVYHRASAIKSAVEYAMIVPSDLLGRPGKYESGHAVVELMRDSNYKHTSVNDGISRPVLFLLYNSVDLERSFGGSFPKMKEVIDAIRRMSIESQMVPIPCCAF